MKKRRKRAGAVWNGEPWSRALKGGDTLLTRAVRLGFCTGLHVFFFIPTSLYIHSSLLPSIQARIEILLPLLQHFFWVRKSTLIQFQLWI